MRLSALEIKTILSSVHVFDKEAIVYLFGSRSDDTRQGGDIDLLIESNLLTREDCNKIRWKIWESIGEQKIDIVLARDTDPAFLRIIQNHRILLQ